jgi:O-6-methylguanine DNA methyltransferase
MDQVYYAAFHTSLGKMHMASTAQGVCKIRLPKEGEEAFFRWLHRFFGEDNTLEGAGWNEAVVAELERYLAGEIREFSCSLDVRGTPFQRAVWEEMRRIPYGTTRTYGDIARIIDHPRAYRAVGAASGANPLPIVVPCHRVIGRDGSLRGYGGGLELKEALLKLEGVILL